MRVEVKMPDMIHGKGGRATLSQWLFCKGDRVEEGDALAEMMDSEKIFDVPAPASGILSALSFEAGDSVKTGDVIAVIEVEGEKL